MKEENKKYIKSILKQIDKATTLFNQNKLDKGILELGYIYHMLSDYIEEGE